MKIKVPLQSHYVSETACRLVDGFLENERSILLETIISCTAANVTKRGKTHFSSARIENQIIFPLLRATKTISFLFDFRIFRSVLSLVRSMCEQFMSSVFCCLSSKHVLIHTFSIQINEWMSEIHDEFRSKVLSDVFVRVTFYFRFCQSITLAAFLSHQRPTIELNITLLNWNCVQK